MIRGRAVTVDEAAEIERLAKWRTAEARVVERARVVALARAGKGAPAIARELGSARRWCGNGWCASTRGGWRGWPTRRARGGRRPTPPRGSGR